MNQKLQERTSQGLAEDLLCTPTFYRLSKPEDRERLDRLLDCDPHLRVCDALIGQLEELVKSQNPRVKFTKEGLKEAALRHPGSTPMEAYGVWVYYPWDSKLVHILDEEEFVYVRTNRNQYKITPAEEEVMATKKIGVIGLSVGKAIANAIAMERICGELRLADFDTVELSNLNRIQTGVRNLGIPKTVVVAREIAEMDPFLKVTTFHEGITEGNVDEFLVGNGKLDLCIEACDGLFAKILTRQRARVHGIAVVMNSSDKGTTDIERYDLHPDLPLLHGLIDHLDLNLVKQAKTNEEKVPYLLPMLGLETCSTRLRASMLEIEQTITTWPQLASGVMLGGAICADVCRRILLDQLHDSGRYFVDLEELVSDKDKPKAEETRLFFRESITQDEMLGIILKAEVSELDGQVLLERPVVEELIAAACLAPSGANIQTWQWVHHGRNIYLFRDDVYVAGLLDCKNTTSIAGLGAATENLVLKAHEKGLEVIFELVPDLDSSSKLIGVFRFFDGQLSASAGRFEPHICDGLAKTIPHRVTNRNLNNVQRTKIAQERLIPLQHLASTVEGAKLLIVDDAHQLHLIGEVTAKLDRMRIMHKGGHDDFHAEVRWTQEEVDRTRNGINILGTIDLTPTELAGWTVAKNWNVIQHLNDWRLGSGLEKVQRKNVATASALGLLTVPRFTNRDFFMAGRALERVWLAANQDGICVHPASLSNLIFNTLKYADRHGFTAYMEAEARMLRKEFEGLFGLTDSDVDVLLLRFFIGDPPKMRSVRYPLERVLSFL